MAGRRRPAARDALPSTADRSRRAWHRRFGAQLRHSLRLKLIVLFLLFALLTSIAFIGGMQRAVSSGWREAARPIIADYVDRLAAEIGSPPDIAKAQALVGRLPLSVRIDGPAVNWASGSAQDRLEQPRGWARDGELGNERSFTSLLTRISADGHRITFGLGDWPLQNRSHRIGWITLAVLLLLTALAYLAIRRMLKPLNDIRAGAARFGRGDFTRPIPVRRRDELGNLARRINASAEQLHGMLEAKRALLLSISHELRSPLTRARLNVELLPETDRNDARLRAALLRDVAQMRDLVDALLEGERLASPHAALQLAPTDVSALARSVLRELGDDLVPSLAAGNNEGALPIELLIEGDLPPVMLDAARIRVLLRNLVRNALQHGAAAGRRARVMLAMQADALVIVVRDFGPGVADDQLARLSEAFFRADQARRRSTGGVGLGLYLCRLIAQAHGGTLTARNAAPGLEWTVRLPAGRLPGDSD